MQASVKLRSHTYELEESDVKLKLTLCDTVGYGDQVNKEDSFGPIVEHVDSQFEAYLQEELKIKRNLSGYHDSRYLYTVFNTILLGEINSVNNNFILTQGTCLPVLHNTQWPRSQVYRPCVHEEAGL